MKLLIIRHAIAMEKEDFAKTTSDDRLRPLTHEGVKKMHKNAVGLKATFDHIDVLISSPLTRAVQTAGIVTDAYGMEDFLQSEALAPEANSAAFFDYLKKFANLRPQTLREGNIALVGHEPNLSSLIAYALTGEKTVLGELRKGGACLIEFPHGLKPGEGHLRWWLVPSQLRKFKA